MNLKIKHVTDYHYDRPVYYALQRLRLTPVSHATQKVIDWTTEIEGATVQSTYEDHFSNHVQMVSTDTGSTLLRIIASGTIETEDTNGVAGPHTGFAPLWLYERDTPLTRSSKAIRDLARTIEKGDDLEKLHALMAAVAGAVRYETGTTHSATTAEQALEAGIGVCQDHAHIFCSAARFLGFPARYISGYLMMDDRTEQTATHAWAEAYVDRLGWVGFDASNAICPDERYARIATGLDYDDAAPVSGIRLGNSSETLAVAITVEQ